MTRETKVPSIPDIRDDNIKEVLAAIKATLQVREGLNGDPLDQSATLRDLLSLNLVSTDGDTEVEGGEKKLPVVSALPPLASGGYNPSVDYTTPAQPTGLLATGGFTNVYLEWGGAPYRNHSYTEIWRATEDNLGAAVLIGTTAANVYADPADANRTYYYWIRFVSEAAVIGPYNSTSGTPATTAINVADVLPDLEDFILDSQLVSALGTRITATETGINSLSEVVGSTARTVSTLSSVTERNQTSLQIQAIVSDGLSAQYTVKIDNNGHVSGFGLASTVVNGTPTSAFIVRADRFAIVGANDATDPLGTLNPTNVPFVVLTTPTVIGGITYPAGVWMKSAFIADATITNAKIQSLTADKITTGSLTAAVGITTGRISGGAAGYDSGTGFWLGNDGGTYKFYVGSSAQNMKWTGSALSVTGNINATSGTFRGITVYNDSNNVILSSSSGINTALLGLGSLAYQNNVTVAEVQGLGNLATQNNVFIGSTVRFPDGSFLNTGDFVNILSKIGSGNISTFIDGLAITSAYIGNAAISTAKIADLAVTNAKINDLSVSKLTAGSLSVGQYIQSSNYSSGGSGFRINADGSAEFGNITARGNITANSLTANTVNTENIVGAAVTTASSTTGGISAYEISLTVNVPSGASLVLLIGYAGDPYYYSGGEGSDGVQQPIGSLWLGMPFTGGATKYASSAGTVIFPIVSPSAGTRTYALSRDIAGSLYGGMSLSVLIIKR